ncbi:MAG: hypothetical protein WDZ75_01970 [Candidatus Paceibacterota bacterium]
MKHFIQHRLKRNMRGFTVIEAFVGITILLIGLVGPLMLVNSNLQAGRFSRDQITAYYLAQEAIEMVREERDENFIAGRGWLAGLDDCKNSNGCRVDGQVGVSDPFLSCSGDCTSPRLQVNTTNGRYGYGAGEDSRFYRHVQIDDNVDSIGGGATVTVTVGFDTGRYIQEYTTTDYLGDWYPQ